MDSENSRQKGEESVAGETIEEYLKRNPDVQKEFKASITAIHENWRRQMAPIHEALKLITEQRKDWWAEWQTQMEMLTLAAKEFSTQVQKEPEALRSLSDYGWYLPYELDGPLADLTRATRYMALISSGKVKKVDREFTTQLDRDLQRIQKQLCEHFPPRAKQIKAAIRAHQKKEYYLSVPVFFALVEGICEEITGYRFFKPESTKKWAMKEGSDLSIMSIILEPLKHVGVARRKQSKIPSGLNRHDVLHGTSVDYGEDPLNSYKALSLLNYVGLSLEFSTRLKGNLKAKISNKSNNK